jgi:hypothetical protein
MIFINEYARDVNVRCFPEQNSGWTVFCVRLDNWCVAITSLL